VLAAPPCGGGGSQIMIRYSIATGLRAVVLAVEDSRWAGLGRLRTRGVDLRRRTETWKFRVIVTPSPRSLRLGCATGIRLTWSRCARSLRLAIGLRVEDWGARSWRLARGGAKATWMGGSGRRRRRLGGTSKMNFFTKWCLTS